MPRAYSLQSSRFPLFPPVKTCLRTGLLGIAVRDHRGLSKYLVRSSATGDASVRYTTWTQRFSIGRGSGTDNETAAHFLTSPQVVVRSANVRESLKTPRSERPTNAPSEWHSWSCTAAGHRFFFRIIRKQLRTDVLAYQMSYGPAAVDWPDNDLKRVVVIPLHRDNLMLL